jgi:hypothetical protein
MNTKSKNLSQPTKESSMDHNPKDQPEAQPETAHSRRGLLGSGAAAAGAAMLGLLAVACGDDDDDSMPSGGTSGTGGSDRAGRSGGDAGRPGGAGTGGTAGRPGTSGTGGTAGMAGMPPIAGGVSLPDADIEPMNVLLTAEYNAIAAYSAGATLIMNADSSDPLYDLRQVIIDIAVDFQSQHRLHAEALVEAIEELDGTPVEEQPIKDDFKAPDELAANPTITNVLKYACSAERGAAVAYNQVLEGMEDAKLRFLASVIEGDESQHFIVLAALVLGLAAPGPNLSSARAGDVVPEAFVSTVSDDYKGLDQAPPDYFP